MSFYHDRQIKNFISFVFFFILALFASGTLLFIIQTQTVRTMLLSHEEAFASSLLEQGVQKSVVAKAVTNTEIVPSGSEFLRTIGITSESAAQFLPFFSSFRTTSVCSMLVLFLFLSLLLLGVTLLFFHKRERLYQQTDDVLHNYIEGNYTQHLPQIKEGTIYHLFSSVEQLATMLQSKNESAQKTKEFLRNTISDISHQLKTPLAALTMYQEIIENEPEHPDTVKEFSAKMGLALNRMEHLIQTMLKITRLDAGSILFEKNICKVSEFVQDSICELTARFQKEHKTLEIVCPEDDSFLCDRIWTMEAVENIVKNALDHTEPGGNIQILCEQSHTMYRIIISDNGHGIAAEDIHHIFKRFYRSKTSSDIRGAGLGLPLAKSIVEGQGGILSVRSVLGCGSTFTLSFPV